MASNTVSSPSFAYECIPGLLARMVRKEYPSDVAALGIPVCCCPGTGDILAVPVRLNCGKHKIAICRLQAATVHLLSPPDVATAALLDSNRMPSLIMREGSLQIIAHTSQGDQCFLF